MTLRRTGFARRTYVAAPPAPVRAAERAACYGGTTTPAPKTEPKRCPNLLKLAEGMRCLLRIGCGGSAHGVVACHSNLHEHGKGGARKADDHYTVWGCAACHRWLDQGTAPFEVKRAAFLKAHGRQRLEWAEIAYDPYQNNNHKPWQRKAASWAFDRCIDDQQAAARAESTDIAIKTGAGA